MLGERTPLLKEHAAEGPEHLSAARKRFIVATALLTGFLSTLDLTSEYSGVMKSIRANSLSSRCNLHRYNLVRA